MDINSNVQFKRVAAVNHFDFAAILKTVDSATKTIGNVADAANKVSNAAQQAQTVIKNANGTSQIQNIGYSQQTPATYYQQPQATAPAVSTQMLIMIGGGVLVLVIVMFMFRPKS